MSSALSSLAHVQKLKAQRCNILQACLIWSEGPSMVFARHGRITVNTVQPIFQNQKNPEVAALFSDPISRLGLRSPMHGFGQQVFTESQAKW